MNIDWHAPTRKSRRRRVEALTACVALLSGLMLGGDAFAADFLVNNNNDAPDISPGDGNCWTGAWVSVGQFGLQECSLRAAIEETNALAGADVIGFSSLLDVNVFGTVVISVTSPLAFIGGPLTIDGTTVPAYDENDPDEVPVIVLDGGLIGAGNGLYFGEPADGSKLLGLAVMRFAGSGVVVAGADSMTLQGNHIGLDRGFVVRGNAGHGIQVSTASTGTTIGQTFDPASGYSGRGNVIAGNGGDGIAVGGTNTVIAGNKIGTDRFGNAVVNGGGDHANGGWGVRTYGSGDAIRVGRTNFSPSLGNLASGNTIAGNRDGGVKIESSSTNASIYANHIGIGANGTTGLGNGTRSGIDLRADGVTVGDTGVGGNVISGHSRYAIEAYDVDGVDVIGNIVGLNAAANSPVGNALEAILFVNASNTEVSHNIVGGNGDDGIYVSGSFSIHANYVGTNADGLDLGNAERGIVVYGSNGEIGSPGLGNVVGFNGENGIDVLWDCYDTDVRSNWVGVDPAGRNIGNDGSGIVHRGEVAYIGGHETGQKNTIGNNGNHGIELISGSRAALIEGNYIGTDASDGDHGNAGHGVDIADSTFNIIGASRLTFSSIETRANTIAWNGGDGVSISETALAADDNDLIGNRFFENGGIAIDLGDDGPTANDLADGDIGENHLQNSPVLDPGNTAYDWSTGDLDIRYLVSTAVPNAAYPIRVDFYTLSDDGQEPGDWIGSDTYMASDAMSNRDVTIVPSIPMAGDETIVSIATDSNGNSSEAGNTTVVPEPGFSGLLASGGILLGGLARKRRARGARA